MYRINRLANNRSSIPSEDKGHFQNIGSYPTKFAKLVLSIFAIASISLSAMWFFTTSTEATNDMKSESAQIVQNDIASFKKLGVIENPDMAYWLGSLPRDFVLSSVVQNGMETISYISKNQLQNSTLGGSFSITTFKDLNSFKSRLRSVNFAKTASVISASDRTVRYAKDSRVQEIVTFLGISAIVEIDYSKAQSAAEMKAVAERLAPITMGAKLVN